SAASSGFARAGLPASAGASPGTAFGRFGQTLRRRPTDHHQNRGDPTDDRLSDLPDLPVAVRLVNQTGGVPSALGFQDDVRSERVAIRYRVGVPLELVTGLAGRALGQFAVLLVVVLEQWQVNDRRSG